MAKQARKNSGAKRAARGSMREHGGGFQIRWIDADGVRRSETFTDRQVATLALSQRLVDAERARAGFDMREKPAEPPTLADAASMWLDARAHLRSIETYRSNVRAHLLDYFGATTRIDRIGVREVDAFKRSRAHLHPNTVNHALAALRALLRYARKAKLLREVPEFDLYGARDGVNPHTRAFRYLKTAEEVRRFLGAARAEPAATFALYAMAVLTGLRAGELAALRWSDIDLGRRVIVVRRSHDGPTKSGLDRCVPIVDALAGVLASWQRVCPPGEIVFPTRAGTQHLPSARVFQETFRRVAARAGFERGYVVFHSLRHTFASHYVMDGGDLYRLQSILGHASVAMTRRYAHLSPHAFEADRARLSALLPDEPAAEPQSNVVRLPLASRGG